MGIFTVNMIHFSPCGPPPDFKHSTIWPSLRSAKNVKKQQEVSDLNRDYGNYVPLSLDKDDWCVCNFCRCVCQSVPSYTSCYWITTGQSHVRTVSANERRRYICNVLSHWLIPFSRDLRSWVKTDLDSICWLLGWYDQQPWGIMQDRMTQDFLTHLPWTKSKCPPFRRRHFQMHFHEWKVFSFWFTFHWSLLLRALLTLSQH